MNDTPARSGSSDGHTGDPAVDTGDLRGCSGVPAAVLLKTSAQRAPDTMPWSLYCARERRRSTAIREGTASGRGAEAAAAEEEVTVASAGRRRAGAAGRAGSS